MKSLTINTTKPKLPPTRDLHTHDKKLPESLPEAKEVKVHPTNSGSENASLYFVGTATCLMYVSAGSFGVGRNHVGINADGCHL